VQKAQTSVIKANLNPVWNEELKLSVPQQYGPLKLVNPLTESQPNLRKSSNLFLPSDSQNS
jgi:hypothetical protein